MEGIIAIIAFLIGWLLAQLGKFLSVIIRKKEKLKFKDLVAAFTKSGGMPSGHTASFVALDAYLACALGINSPIFALALCTTIIFIYDAVNVRYAVGEQGKLINSIVRTEDKKGRTLRVVEGHTVPQVIVGALIGVAVGLICFAVFK